MLLNQTLPLTILTANSLGSSSGDLLTEVLVLHGQGMDGFSRAPQWFADTFTHSAEQDPDILFLQFCLRALVFFCKPCITWFHYAFFYVLH